MNKEQDLANALARTAIFELAALREAKNGTKNACRVSNAAKVTAFQEKYETIAER